MAQLASVDVDVSVDLDELERELDRAEARTKRFAKNMKASVEEVEASLHGLGEAASDVFSHISEQADSVGRTMGSGFRRSARQTARVFADTFHDEVGAQFRRQKPFTAAMPIIDGEFTEVAQGTVVGLTQLAAATTNLALASHVVRTPLLTARREVENTGRALTLTAREVGRTGTALVPFQGVVNNTSSAVSNMASVLGAGVSIGAGAGAGVGSGGGTLNTALSYLGGIALRVAGILTGTLHAAFSIFNLAVLAAIPPLIAWSRATGRIEDALRGVGKSVGVTVEDVNEMAFAMSRAERVSVGYARNMITAWLQTGKVSKENLMPAASAIAQLRHNFGMTREDASQTLSRALTGDARAAEDFLRSIKALTSENAQLIRSFAAVGDQAGIQRVVFDAMNRALVDQKLSVTTLGQAWQNITSWISRATNSVGEFASHWTGIGASDKRQLELYGGWFERYQRLPEIFRRALELNPFFGTALTFNARYLGAEVDRMTRKIEQMRLATEFQRNAALDATIMPVVSKYLPQIEQRDQLLGEMGLLLQGLERYKQTSGDAFDPRVVDLYTNAIARARGEFSLLFRTAESLRAEELALDRRAVQAISPQQRANVEYERELLRIRRQFANDLTSPQAQQALANAEMVRSNTLLGVRVQITRQQQQQLLSARQTTELAGLEATLAGRTSIEQERQRQLLQARQNLEQEALNMYGSKEAYNRAHLKLLEDEINKTAKINELRAMRVAIEENLFQRAQLFRTPLDQQVYAQVRAAGLDINSVSGQLYASQVRVTEQLRTNIQLSDQFISGFAQSMLRGASATQALSNQLARLADHFIDLASKQAAAALWGGSGLGGLITGGRSGWTASGATGAAGAIPNPLAWLGALHGGGIAGRASQQRLVPVAAFAGAQYMHDGGIAGLRDDEVATVLKKGEPVFRDMDHARQVVGGNMGGVNISIGSIAMPEDPEGNDPSGSKRAAAIAEAFRAVAMDVIAKQLRPRGGLNRPNGG